MHSSILSKKRHFVFNLLYEYILISGSFFRKLFRKLTLKNTTAIFLHGLDDPFQNHLDYLRLIAQKGYDVYALNLPAHGKSAVVSNLSWGNLVDIVHDFFLQNNLKKITLIGYSMGGGVALKLLQKHPHKIKELKLIAPFCYSVDTMVQNLREITGIFKFGIDFISKYRILGKLRPQLYPTNLQNITPIYVPLFLKYELDLSLNKIPIKAILFQDDELINVEKAHRFLIALPFCNVQVMKNMIHDIHFLKNDQIIAMVNALFST